MVAVLETSFCAKGLRCSCFGTGFFGTSSSSPKKGSAPSSAIRPLNLANGADFAGPDSPKSPKSSSFQSSTSSLAGCFCLDLLAAGTGVGLGSSGSRSLSGELEVLGFFSSKLLLLLAPPNPLVGVKSRPQSFSSSSGGGKCMAGLGAGAIGSLGGSALGSLDLSFSFWLYFSISSTAASGGF